MPTGWSRRLATRSQASAAGLITSGELDGRVGVPGRISEAAIRELESGSRTPTTFSPDERGILVREGQVAFPISLVLEESATLTYGRVHGRRGGIGRTETPMVGAQTIDSGALEG